MAIGIEGITTGNVRALARAISLVENGGPEAVSLLKSLYPLTGRAYIIGVTGPPGSGKSTLVDRIIAYYRAQDRKVGVLAVDPSSPFTGGAILGDRVRMQRHANDPGVYIRSLASRGHLGGLSLATADAAKVLDAAGYDIVLIETVGIGQSEVEISSQADSTILVTVPGLGDDVQVLKAGVMEIADIFVVNKADREGVERTLAEIEQLLAVREMDQNSWRPPIVPVVAREAIGLEELMEAVEKHQAYLKNHGLMESRRKERLRREVHSIIVDRLNCWAESWLKHDLEARDNLEGLYSRDTDPHSVAEAVLRHLEMERMIDTSEAKNFER